MKRNKSGRNPHRQTGNGIRFETLEDRNLLAFAIDAVPTLTEAATSQIWQVDPGISVADQLEVLKVHVQAGEHDEFRLTSSKVDGIGMVHTRYQHFFQDVPVEGSVYTVHSRNGEIVSLSGAWVDVADDATIQAGLGNRLAGQSAVEFVMAHDPHGHDDDDGDEHDDHDAHETKTLVWEDEVLAQMLGLGSGPSGELAYYQTAQGQVELTYKFDIYVTAPEVQRTFVYVNANTGDIEGHEDRVHGADTAADGTSLYDGTVDFTADVQLVGSVFEFRLRQAVNGVETYDLNNSTNYGTAVDFTSSTSTFDDADHPTGVQAHWGTEATQDYFTVVHGRNSFDDAGAILRSYVSYDTNYVNAFWNGSWMTYGDGNGTTWGPLVSLDVVGHEIAHGVTQYASDLVYANESGALNESFSDIFGEMVERYARGSNDWLIGADFDLVDGDGFRSMSNPNAKGDPDTYEGDFWYTGSADNGGVHTNSGVQNKWFYILSVGETGVNDHGFAYDVTGIGMDDAEAIAYRNLTTYLNPNSTYQEARDGAIQAAVDLFGAGSAQQIATDMAWQAVGVYPESREVHFEAVAPLGSTIYEANYSDTIVAGRNISFAVRIDPGQTLSVMVDGQDSGLMPGVSVASIAAAPLASGVPIPGGDVTVINTVNTTTGGDYTVTVSGLSGTTGDFRIQLVLNAHLEAETFGAAGNDSLVDADFIELSATTPGTNGSRLGVVGELVGTSPGTGAEDFESGVLGGGWSTYSSHPAGLVEVTDAYGAASGNYALVMHQGAFGSYNLNEAILQVDLSSVANPVLNFDHIRFGDENHRLPSKGFVGHYTGDGVSISGDGNRWYPVMNAEFIPSDVWYNVQVDLVQAASNFDISLGPNFQIKFQQYDNFGIPFSDGRGFDNIFVGALESDDWYSFDAVAGDILTVAATSLEMVPDIELELFDSLGNPLGTGTPGDNVTREIIQTPVVADGMHYVRIQGEGRYSLVVTRNAAFDLESTPSQPMELVNGALGFVSGWDATIVEPDSFDPGTILNNAFPGVTLSTGTGGDVFAALATAYTAPTDEVVFASSPTGADGWSEPDDVLVAVFDDLQQYVSIDVGSDDASDVGRLRAYDTLGNLLDEVVSSGLAIGASETLVINRPGADIAYIEATGVASDVTPLDRLVFRNAAVDTDEYTFNASAAQLIRIDASLPGGGLLEFDNYLFDPSGNHIHLELYDPSMTLVATGTDVLEHSTRVSGTFTLVVSANDWAGEYFVDKTILDLSVLNFDFNTLSSATFPGYTPVADGVYDALAGFGFTEQIGFGLWEAPKGDDLVRDGFQAERATFEADVVNGEYTVEFVFGVEPQTIDLAWLELEGTGGEIKPAENTVDMRFGTVTDGGVTITMDGYGANDPLAYLSALRIYPTYGSSLPFRSIPSGNEPLNAKLNLGDVTDWQQAVFAESTDEDTRLVSVETRHPVQSSTGGQSRIETVGVVAAAPEKSSWDRAFQPVLGWQRSTAAVSAVSVDRDVMPTTLLDKAATEVADIFDWSE